MSGLGRIWVLVVVRPQFGRSLLFVQETSPDLSEYTTQSHDAEDNRPKTRHRSPAQVRQRQHTKRQKMRIFS